jgi:hypothetical protein
MGDLVIWDLVIWDFEILNLRFEISDFRFEIYQSAKSQIGKSPNPKSILLFVLVTANFSAARGMRPFVRRCRR